VTAVILSVTLTQSGPGPNVLSNAVSAQLAQTHLSNLLDLVNNDVYQNSRSVRLGYNTSLKYVADTLAEQAPSFVQSTQSFPVQIWELIGTPSFISSGLGEFAYNVDYAVPPYGHPGVLTDLPLTVHLDVYCEQFETGKTGALLILRGNCTYAIKAENAIAAGYDALIIVNNVPDGIPQVTLGADYDIVVVTTTEAAGLSVVVAHETEAQLISVSVSSQIEDTVTTNLCADTPDGDASTVVVLGSHLDSVDAGPGMNDNGSGSAANLVLAIKFYELGLKATNKLRFCWWAAEEIGLIGSTKYVEQASATGEINNIAGTYIMKCFFLKINFFFQLTSTMTCWEAPTTAVACTMSSLPPAMSFPTSSTRRSHSRVFSRTFFFFFRLTFFFLLIFLTIQEILQRKQLPVHSDPHGRPQ